MESPDRTQRVTVRVPENLLDEYDDVCDDRGVSRSEAIRNHMQQTIEDCEMTTRQMPADDDLSTAYRALLRITKGGGWVQRDRACGYLAQQLPDIDKSNAYGLLIKPLRQMGYLRQQVSDDGRHISLKVRA
ncbi:CopG family ribbon-helix-helix protein [Halorientalis brevis]|uniref:CopG family ribbon-helix-helix protein n=2 Tax=Halorientalis brevis TaxID=1126241 RepID=A0ABD6CEM9_9EURY